MVGVAHCHNYAIIDLYTGIGNGASPYTLQAFASSNGSKNVFLRPVIQSSIIYIKESRGDTHLSNKSLNVHC